MTTKEYFNDKIDWKIFNNILDTCIDIEDSRKWFKIQIAVINHNRKISDYISDYIYSDYNILYTFIGGFNPIDTLGNVIDDKYNEEKSIFTDYPPRDLEIIRLRYLNYGLFYILSLREENAHLLKPVNRKIKLYKHSGGTFVYTKI